jgi:hypothetical protein
MKLPATAVGERRMADQVDWLLVWVKRRSAPPSSVSEPKRNLDDAFYGYWRKC